MKNLSSFQGLAGINAQLQTAESVVATERAIARVQIVKVACGYRITSRTEAK